ncbi:hypothetical protein DVK02_05165 [Halobellus sp. Atlit-31R]|nr:hypothetical protein DVK02_05165 [Halobellus sp. Atlit-31R]
MDCPRCGTALASYALPQADRVAVVCERCGFADVPASHHADVVAEESWDHALERLENSPRAVLDDDSQTARTEGVSVPADRREPTDRVSLDSTGVSVGTVIDRGRRARASADESAARTGGETADESDTGPATDEADARTVADGEEADFDSEEGDSDREEADFDSEEGDSDREEADLDGEEGDSDSDPDDPDAAAGADPAEDSTPDPDREGPSSETNSDE